MENEEIMVETERKEGKEKEEKPPSLGASSKNSTQ